MKRFISCLAVAIPLLLAACKKDEVFKSEVAQGPEPTAVFSYALSPDNPLHVTFNNTSANAESVYWQFGDGTTSTETSPVHVYSTSAKYKVVLKTVSAAGYAATDTMTIAAAAPATANFDFSAYLLQTTFSNLSTGAESVLWDFGDNTTSTDFVPMHEYAVAGTYNVTLTVHGITGNTVTQTKAVTVSGFKNLIKGGTFDAGTERYWSTYQNNNPPTFGYTGDSPAGGTGACLRFPSFQNSSNSNNQLIYQAVQVVAGKQYKMSAVIKAPGGGYQCYFQFFISTDANTWQDADPPGGNQFLAVNTWHGWGSNGNSAAINGDLLTVVQQNGGYGFGVATGGIYTATQTRTVYIGIQAGTWSGKSNGDWLVDNFSFQVLN